MVNYYFGRKISFKKNKKEKNKSFSMEVRSWTGLHQFGYFRLHAEFTSERKVIKFDREKFLQVGVALKKKSCYICDTKKGGGSFFCVLADGVTGNTSDFGSEESRFEPWSANYKPAQFESNLELGRFFCVAAA